MTGAVLTAAEAVGWEGTCGLAGGSPGQPKNEPHTINDIAVHECLISNT